MQNAISLLGSTGSIGRQTLEVAELLGLRVRALTANKNIALLEEQTRKFRPAVVAVFDDYAAHDFRARVRDTDVRVVSGMDGLVEAATIEGADTVVTAVVGTAGLLPTLAAIGLGRRIALANKETLVCAGDIVINRARAYGADIIPVDSEHSALFQCLAGQYPVIGGEHPAPGKQTAPFIDNGSQYPSVNGCIKKLILTASGGPFRGMNRADLQNVTPEMALRHPNWSMGQKVTIDSATMMNKGLEVIEAMHLFGVPPGKIEVVVHPESIIHSMVEFADSSVIAQLSVPDMRLPIQYALTYPERVPSLATRLDITRHASLTFEQPDLDAFPCLGLAFETVKINGTACAVLNAANEAAVGLFLGGKLNFYGISDSVRAALENIENIEDPTLDDVISADNAAREFVNKSAGSPSA